MKNFVINKYLVLEFLKSLIKTTIEERKRMNGSKFIKILGITINDKLIGINIPTS